MKQENQLQITLSLATIISIIGSAIVLGRMIGQKEEQLRTLEAGLVEARVDLRELTSVSANLTKTVTELAKTVEFGVDSSRETREALREVDARLHALELRSAERDGASKSDKTP